MLRRLKIRSKLVAVVLPPVAALAVLAAIVIRPLLDDVSEAKAVTRYAQLAATVNPLVHDLQLEGGLSAQALATKNPAVTDALATVRTNTDGSARTFASAATATGGLSAHLASRLRAAKLAVDSMPAVRKSVDGAETPASDVWAKYTKAVDALLEVQAGFVAGPALTDPVLQRRANALVELSLATDALSHERTLLALAMAGGSVDRQAFGQLNRYVGSYEDHVRRFRQDADPAELAQFDKTKTAADAAYTASVESSVMAPTPDAAALQGDPVTFFNAMTTRLDGLRKVESDAAARLRAGAASALADAQRKLGTYAGGVAFALVAALVLAALVSRSLTRPVRRLTLAADEAGRRLPQLVEQIQSSDDAIDTSVMPISVRAGGEIGQLTDAFNTVQQVAVATAVEQASLRRAIGAMFVNLGRRSQTLVDRQLELIDQLENNEKDPDSLNDLFALDHLATRMRRNAENLLVLAGQDPPRKWGRSMPLIDVLRAAVSEVEDYTRVDIHADEELYLAGHAATDVAHLVAELVENATAFSPPTSRVRVRVEPAGERYIVSVVDQGIGMTDADLSSTNERLAGDSSEIALSNRIGFYVIGRLARRIGVAVRLGRSSGGGVIAQVALPIALVTTSKDEAAAPAAGGEHDPLADSPQSARERLLGALRSAPGAGSGPVSGGPRPAVSSPLRSATPAPLPGAANDERYTGWGDEPAEPTAPALPSRRAAEPASPALELRADLLAVRPTARPPVEPPPAYAPAQAAPVLSPEPGAPPPPPPPMPGRSGGFAPPPPASWSPPKAGAISPPALPAALAGAAAAMQVDGGSPYDRQAASAGFAGLSAPVHGDGDAAPASSAGLPQRRAGSTRRAEPETAPAPAHAGDGKGRSADDVRSMLSRFRSGVERGRQLPDPTAAISPEDRS